MKSEEEQLEINGFILHKNSAGRGKGLATYYRPSLFQQTTDVKDTNFQITKLESVQLDVISVYRSKEGKITELTNQLMAMINYGKDTLICGDFNICFYKDRKNRLIRKLEEIGFEQHVKN